MDSIVHFEIPADDTARATKFYKSVFGWDIEKVPNMEYYMARTTEVGKDRMPKKPGAINGAIMEKSKMAKAPVITINVPSIETAAKKIEKSGGKIIQPKMDVMNMGYYAMFTDPEGNVMSLWEEIKKTAEA